EIEGLFSLEKNAKLERLLLDQGIEMTDDLIIRREILANGRSVSRINGQMVNLSVLKEVGQFLVDIHGQHDQEELMKAPHHIGL
ncbi:DNA repair protein RecN, partial [Streptococcus pyogenes]